MVLWPLSTVAVIALILCPFVDYLQSWWRLWRLSALIILYGDFASVPA